MTTPNPDEVRHRSRVSGLVAAAFDGDERALRTLHLLAHDIAPCSAAEADAARRALQAIDGSTSDGSCPPALVGRAREPWVTGYVDQLLARHRDVGSSADPRLEMSPDRGAARRGEPRETWMGQVSEWPSTGDRVLVWSERPPSSRPRDPFEATVDHVAGRTFTVTGLDATFNRSTGRSKTVRHGAGAFATTIYVAVDADSDQAHEVLGDAAKRDRDAEAARAVYAWLAERSDANRRAAIDALTALDDL